MFVREAKRDDIADILEIYQDGYERAYRAGSELWEAPHKTLIEEALDNLYVFEGRKMYGSEILGTVSLTRTPNPQIWNTSETSDKHLYFSKLAVSDAGLGYLSVRNALKHIYEAFGENQTLRWDLLSENKRQREYYLSLGAVDNGNVLFQSEKRGTTISLTRFSLTYEALKLNSI